VARLYADENSPYPAELELRRLGHDVLTLQETGQAGQKLADETVLADASKEGRVVLTHNRRDFIHLHDASPNHAGIVVCSIDLDFVGLARRIDTALQSPETTTGRLIRINRREESPTGKN
jgi:predicted nuclease of predicted toxin-antitoxin system